MTERITAECLDRFRSIDVEIRQNRTETQTARGDIAMMAAQISRLDTEVHDLRHEDIPELKGELTALFRNGKFLELLAAVEVLKERTKNMLEAQKQATQVSAVIGHVRTKDLQGLSSKLRYLPLWAYVVLGGGLTLGGDFLRGLLTKIVELWLK